jgi:beta-lactamase regulating signal transducer with metallopeptidase domain
VGDTGLILSMPTESVAIRAIVASVAAVLLARMLLQRGLRVPRVRALAALVPSIALVVVVVLFADLRSLPVLWVPVDAVDALPVPVRDSYLTFAPLATPLLLGSWLAVALVRIVLRVSRLWRASRAAQRFLAAGVAVPAPIRVTVAVLASRMRVAVPEIAIVEDCRGGAGVVGIRRPVLLLDRDLVAALDHRELEGVLAHELAHVRRRDNLLALACGLVRDVCFFVPGGRWALRQLHGEREVAADTLAVGHTRRPGALASGLLKAIERGTATASTCAALLPAGTSLVARVERLCDDRPAPSRTRSGLEVGAVVTAVTVAVATAVQVPAMVSGAEGERDALGVMWTSVPAATATDEAAPLPESRAFGVYRGSRIDRTPPPAGAVTVVDDADEVRPEVLRACGTLGQCADADVSYSLGIAPRPRVRTGVDLSGLWRVEPVVSTGNEGLSVFWFQRVDGAR